MGPCPIDIEARCLITIFGACQIFIKYKYKNEKHVDFNDLEHEDILF